MGGGRRFYVQKMYERLANKVGPGENFLYDTAEKLFCGGSWTGLGGGVNEDGGKFPTSTGGKRLERFRS